VIADVRRALVTLDRADRLRWIALVPLAVLAAGLEAAGAAAVFVLVRVMADPARPRIRPAALARAVHAADPLQTTLRVAAVVGVFYLARSAVLLAVAWTQERIVERTATRIATGLLARYLYAPYALHLRRAGSSLVHAVRDYADVIVEMILASAVQLGSEALIVIGLLALVGTVAPAETLGAAAVVLALLVAPLGATRRWYARWGDEERRIGERTVAKLQQALDAIKAIMVSGQQAYFVEQFARERAALERAKRRRRLAGATQRVGVETVFVCALLLAAAMMTAAGRSGADAVSMLSLFAYAGFRIVPSANRIVHAASSLRFGRAYLDAVAADWRALDERAPAAAAALPPLAHAIELEDVSFTYDPSRSDALRDVRLSIRRGTSVAIVGATGSGKSTLVDVMLGLLAPTRGRVLVDGRDIRDAARAWQSQIGYVPQDVWLVDDTLRRNVAFGVDPDRIDEDRVVEAVRIARLDGWVASLPDGLGTRVGERGVKLSGGERQRVAIARALYAGPRVLVFDEAMAALDPQTEGEVAAAIDTLRGDRTIVAVAHRLSTARRCDRIVMLQAGRVVAAGRYEELLETSEAFRALGADADDVGRGTR
jgi:ATP-binding cassette, subfamily B, bacterial PglK